MNRKSKEISSCTVARTKLNSNKKTLNCGCDVAVLVTFVCQGTSEPIVSPVHSLYAKTRGMSLPFPALPSLPAHTPVQIDMRIDEPK